MDNYRDIDGNIVEDYSEFYFDFSAGFCTLYHYFDKDEDPHFVYFVCPQDSVQEIMNAIYHHLSKQCPDFEE